MTNRRLVKSFSSFGGKAFYSAPINARHLRFDMNLKRKLHNADYVIPQ